MVAAVATSAVVAIDRDAGFVQDSGAKWQTVGGRMQGTTSAPPMSKTGCGAMARPHVAHGGRRPAASERCRYEEESRESSPSANESLPMVEKCVL